MNSGKGMTGAPKVIYYVWQIRNTGWPTGRESYGHGVLIVLSERESRLHGEAGQVDSL